MSNVVNDTIELAEKYDELSDSQFENGLVLLNKLGISEGSAVLDIGCGTGRLALHTAKEIGEGKIIGIDPSPVRIQVATRKVKEDIPVTFRVGNAQNLSDFIDNSFDIAYLSAVFHWISDKRSALQEIHRVLKPGGKVGLTTGDRDTPFTLRKIIDEVLQRDAYSKEVDINKDSSRPVTENELINLFNAAGYEHLDISKKDTKMYFPGTQDVFDFIESSSFGTFLAHVPDHLRSAARRDIGEELEKRRTPYGIELTSNLMFVIASKNN